MKKIIYIFQLLSVVLLMGACATEELKVTPNDSKGIPFTLEISNKTVTSRAAYYTEAGATGYNENVIKRADVFFYTDQRANAVYKISKTWSAPQEQSAELDGTIPSDILSNVSSLYAYVVVNGPQTPEVNNSNDTKIATLKQIGIEADFTTYTAATTERSAYSQTDFVMDGEDNLTIASDKKSISGNILLYRAASKIALFIKNLTEYIDGDGNTWTPQETGMSISFYNGVNKSRINVETNDRTTGNYFNLSESPEDANDNVRFALSKQASDNSDTQNINESTAYTHFPFYSYSSNWGRDTNPDQEAYLSLRIYWKKSKDKDGNTLSGSPEPYYYRVPINLEDYTVNGVTYPGKQLQRNTYYKVLLEVGVLGDKSENSQVELTPNYIVANWNDEPIEVQLADYHYLVVEKNFVEMFNQESVTIGYECCEDVTASIISISVPDFSTNTIGTINYTIRDSNSSNNTFTVSRGVAGSSNVSNSKSNLLSLLRDCTLTLNQQNKNINITHNLQNDNTTKPYDYAMYTIVVRITTSCGLTEDIEINQYPARYIEGEKDEDRWNLAGDGSVFINGHGQTHSSENNNPQYWDRVMNTLKPSSATNSNPNMYIVTVTSFAANQSDFIIADPRTLEIDNLENIISNNVCYWKNTDNGDVDVSGKNNVSVNNAGIITKAPNMYDNTERGLKYYYPTKTGEENANLIAPKFRIVSAYGRMGNGNYSIADLSKRCATYQEYGYPAGRWRLPTAAELKYIGQLCADGVIPPLFSNANYNSANGRYNYNNGSFTLTSTGTASTRCVYDEWYWEDKCPENQFTWGDRPR